MVNGELITIGRQDLIWKERKRLKITIMSGSKLQIRQKQTFSFLSIEIRDLKRLWKSISGESATKQHGHCFSIVLLNYNTVTI